MFRSSRDRSRGQRVACDAGVSPTHASESTTAIGVPRVDYTTNNFALRLDTANSGRSVAVPWKRAWSGVLFLPAPNLFRAMGAGRVAIATVLLFLSWSQPLSVSDALETAAGSSSSARRALP